VSYGVGKNCRGLYWGVWMGERLRVKWGARGGPGSVRSSPGDRQGLESPCLLGPPDVRQDLTWVVAHLGRNPPVHGEPPCVPFPRTVTGAGQFGSEPRNVHGFVAPLSRMSARPPSVPATDETPSVSPTL